MKKDLQRLLNAGFEVRIFQSKAVTTKPYFVSVDNETDGYWGETLDYAMTLATLDLLDLHYDLKKATTTKR